MHDGGIYAQDRWTVDRLTLNLGVRWDFYRTSFPAQTLGPTVYTPNRNVTFAAGDLASFNDITPKLGVAYDLFGNGRTALKASLAKYVEQLTYTGTYGDSANPAQRTVQSVTRQWNDIDTDFNPDCDLRQPAPERRVPADQQPRLRQPGSQHDLRSRHARGLGQARLQLGDLRQRAARSWCRTCRSTSAISGAGMATSSRPTTVRWRRRDFTGVQRDRAASMRGCPAAAATR